MNEKDIKKIFDEFSGVMKTKDLINRGIYYKKIQRLVDDGIIENVKRGYYQYVDDNIFSEVPLIKSMYPKGIICRESALYYYGYTNRTPNAWHIAVEKSSSRIRSKNYPIINLHFIHSDKLHIGMTTANIDDVDVNIYDKERVICDCLINRSRMDAEEFNFAIKSYIDDTDKNIIRLLEYAKKFKIERKIYEVISIWL